MENKFGLLLLMDNSKAHYNEEIRIKLETLKFKILLLPPNMYDNR